jgi:hypothetical protein
MLFDPCDRPGCDTLEDLYLSVVRSIDCFQSKVAGKQSDFQICEELRGRLRAIEAAVGKLPPDLVGGSNLTAADFVKCQVACDSDTGKLMIDREDLLASDRQMLVARLSREDAPFNLLAESDFTELGHAEGRTFIYRSQEVVLLVLASAHVLAAWQAVEKRHEAQSGGKLNLEFVASRSDAWNTIKRFPLFNNALNVVVANLGQEDTGAAEARLISWLLQFDSGHRNCLLEVIAAHDCIQQVDVDRLLTSIEERYRRDQGDVVFTVKDSSDFGGIQRIFAQKPGLARRLNLGCPVREIVRIGRDVSPTAPGDDSKNRPRLIVAHDVGVSGSQISKALHEYYLATEWREELAQIGDMRHYHRMKEADFADFKKGLSTFGEVCFIFGLYTPDAEQKIREAFGPGISPTLLRFDGRCIRDGSQTLEKAAELPPERRAEFAKLVQDEGLIRSMFEIPKEAESLLKRERDHTERINLIVRVGTVTKMTAQLFTLKPLKPGVEPLFERIEEHPYSPR